MIASNLRYLSQQVVDNLQESIEKNIERYRSGDFSDLVAQGGWDIELRLSVDLDPLKDLTGHGADAEIKNSILVWSVLAQLTPSLAMENRVWTRLCHVECLSYARERWLGQQSDSELATNVGTHLFGSTQTRCRDDNALGRLWWNGFIAHLAMPNSMEIALRQILKTADVRSNIVERSLISSRSVITAGIVRAMIKHPDITKEEQTFRDFMIAVNRNGGGLLFELMSEKIVDGYMEKCVEKALA